MCIVRMIMMHVMMINVIIIIMIISGEGHVAPQEEGCCSICVCDRGRELSYIPQDDKE